MMRRRLMGLLTVLAMLLGTASPAQASWEAKNCTTLWKSRTAIRLCAIVNQHDFWQWRNAIGRAVHVQGGKYVWIEHDWVRLLVNGTVVRNNGANTLMWLDPTTSPVSQWTDWYSPCPAGATYRAKWRVRIDWRDGTKTPWYVMNSGGYTPNPACG